jgi:hypothetical protein
MSTYITPPKGHCFINHSDIFEVSKSLYCLMVDGRHVIIIVSKGSV